MRSLLACRVLIRYLGLATLAVLLIGCGAASDEEVPAPTQSPTVAISTPDLLIEEATEEEGDGGGGNVVTRSLRSGGSWVWSGLTWVWDRGSDGANAVWDAISGTGSFLWGTIRGLPSDAWDQIQRFWSWIWGTGFGATVAHAASAIPEKIAELNPMGLIQRLVAGIVTILKIGVAGLVLVGIAYVFYKFRIISIIRRVMSRRPLAQPSRVRRTTPAGDSAEHKMVIEVQHAPALTLAPATSVPQVPAAANSPIPGSGVLTMWSRDQIRELRALVTNPTIVSLFDLASKRDGGPVNYREVVQETGLDAVQVGDHFSSFFHKAKAIHNDEHWPLEIVPPTDEHSGRAYFVPRPYLDWWFEE